MPLDAAVQPKNVTATLFYQVRTDRKPERYVGELPPGVEGGLDAQTVYSD